MALKFWLREALKPEEEERSSLSKKDFIYMPLIGGVQRLIRLIKYKAINQSKAKRKPVAIAFCQNKLPEGTA